MLPTKFKYNKCIVKLDNCLFKNSINTTQSIFKQPISDFQIFLPNQLGLPSKYAIVGRYKTEFLNGLAMKYLPFPPLSRQYPLMSELKRYDIIEYLNFKESSGLEKTYLSARYESFAYKGELEMANDVNSVKNYICGSNNYNTNHEDVEEQELLQIMDMFNLKHLKNKWINSLSNGQLRRARIAKSVLNKPKLLIIDDPFLGLDPKQTQLVSNSLNQISKSFNMAIVLGLRFQDDVPEWLDYMAEIEDEGLIRNGKKDEVIKLITNDKDDIATSKNYEMTPITNDDLKDPYIEFDNASVVYKGLPILEQFSWKIPKGSNWRILGENGTGKTTIISLITADHPQSWRSVLKINNQLRKTGCGVTFFDVNNEIGMSSPELHALVPVTKTMKAIINNGLVRNIGNSNFHFNDFTVSPHEKISSILEIPEIREVLQQHGEAEFGKLSVTNQKLTLFLRAIIKDPKLIILDEAFSCMDDVKLMQICHEILNTYFHDSTILAIGHIDWELPDYKYVIQLTGDHKRSYNLYKLQNN